MSTTLVPNNVQATITGVRYVEIGAPGARGVRVTLHRLDGSRQSAIVTHGHAQSTGFFGLVADVQSAARAGTIHA